MIQFVCVCVCVCVWECQREWETLRHRKRDTKGEREREVGRMWDFILWRLFPNFTCPIIQPFAHSPQIQFPCQSGWVASSSSVLSFLQLSMERSFDVSDLKFISSLFSVWPQMIKAHSDEKVLNMLQQRYKNLFASKSLQHTEEEEDASWVITMHWVNQIKYVCSRNVIVWLLP